VKTLFLFQWDAGAAGARADQLRAAGWQVEVESADGGRGVRRVLDVKPAVIVLDLSLRPSHARECARAIRGYRAFRRTPMIFVGGRESDVAQLKDRIGGAVFTPPEFLLERVSGMDL
jgi:DNA-binding response OmpR family regulator